MSMYRARLIMSSHKQNHTKDAQIKHSNKSSTRLFYKIYIYNIHKAEIFFIQCLNGTYTVSMS
jgi:hypothetical protein